MEMLSEFSMWTPLSLSFACAVHSRRQMWIEARNLCKLEKSAKRTPRRESAHLGVMRSGSGRGIEWKIERGSTGCAWGNPSVVEESKTMM